MIPPSISPTSSALVVTRLRNMSTPIMERPKRYVSTIWKAARKINGNISHTVRPTLLEKDERRAYNPQGSNILHSAMKNGWRSVTTRARFGIVRETTKATISMYVPTFLFIIVYRLFFIVCFQNASLILNRKPLWPFLPKP